MDFIVNGTDKAFTIRLNLIPDKIYERIYDGEFSSDVLRK